MMVIDVETYERALELAAGLSAAPGAGEAGPGVARGAAVPHRDAHGDLVNEPLLRELAAA
jgi:hypothetical protein